MVRALALLLGGGAAVGGHAGGHGSHFTGHLAGAAAGVAAQGPSLRAAAAAQYAMTRSDFIGSLQPFNETLGGCNNAGTCGPSFCSRGANAACANTKSNLTEADMMARVAHVAVGTCTASTDPRCSEAALTAVFGRFPGVKAVYCNDEFIVIHSNNLPNHPSFLDKIQTPPGGGDGGDYSSQCVTRGYATQQYTFKVPLKPVALQTSSGALNNADAFPDPSYSLYFFNKLTQMPTSGPSAFAVNGMPWFPNMNNVGGQTWVSCEVDQCNAHAGKGFDYHYHGDPFGPQCLYSCADYSSLAAHPPLIAYGADGFPVFGRYLSDAAPGAQVALDDCGGHSHSGIGDPFIADGTYHYHSFVQTIPKGAAPQAYTSYNNGPYMCFKGDISKVSSWWVGNEASYGSGNLAQRSDYAVVKPCADSAMYLAPGYSLNGKTGSGADKSALVTGAGNAGGACAAAPTTSSASPTPATSAAPTSRPTSPPSSLPSSPPSSLLTSRPTSKPVISKPSRRPTKSSSKPVPAPAPPPPRPASRDWLG